MFARKMFKNRFKRSSQVISKGTKTPGSGSCCMEKMEGRLMMSSVHPTVAADQLYYFVQPTNTTVGQVFNQIVVYTLNATSHAIDTSNTSAITLSTAAGPGSLGGTVTVSAAAGVATFNNVFSTKPGSYIIQALDASDGGTVSHTFTVAAAAKPFLEFTTGPSSILAGQTIRAMQVTEFDANGNVLSGDTTTVIWLDSQSGPTHLIGGLQVIVNHGIATFSVISLQTMGTYSLIATAPAYGYTAAISGAFNVTPAAPSILVFAAQPQNTTVGTALTPPVVVYLEDPYGNIVRNNTSTATMITASGPSTLLGTTSVAFNNGAAIFSSLHYNVAGTYALIVNDGSFGAPTSTDFNVT